MKGRIRSVSEKTQCCQLCGLSVVCLCLHVSLQNEPHRLSSNQSILVINHSVFSSCFLELIQERTRLRVFSAQHSVLGA